jgi:membrane protein DedA with SNARE-associated domain/rhodanese-related sulfurtransferase
MTDHLTLLISEYGVLVMGILVLLDQAGLPVPAYPALVVAGAAGANGRLAEWPVFSICVLACLAADSVWFLLGRSHGMRILKTLCRISLEPDSCVSDTQSRFERWGVGSLLIAKFIPGLSIIAPPLAGALRIRWWTFLLLSTLGAVFWVASGLLIGDLFRLQIGVWLGRIDRFGRLAAGVGAVLLAMYVAYKAWERARFTRQLRMARIDVAELYDLMEAGAAPVVIDVRTTTARSLEPRWIPSAIHVALEDVARQVRNLPADREVIVYCACPNEASAARVARILMNHGLKKVRPLTGGLDAWIAAGHAVITEAPPAPLRQMT